MKNTVEEAIKKLVQKSVAEKADDALKYSQAALNLAHTLSTIQHIPK